MKSRRSTLPCSAQRIDFDDDEDEPLETGESIATTKRKLNFDQEDVLISIILNHFDAIERKTTDKSLTPSALQERVRDGWAKIKSEFQEQTTVSILNYDFDSTIKSSISKLNSFPDRSIDCNVEKQVENYKKQCSSTSNHLKKGPIENRWWLIDTC